MAISNALIATLLLASSAFATPTPAYSRQNAEPEKRAIRSPVHRRIVQQKRDTGAVEASFDGGGWLLPVLIGGQQLILNIDTGSSDIWTASTLMPSSQQSTVTSGYIFDPTKSSTFQYMNGSTYGIGYADGSGSSGKVGIDTVNFGGATVTMPFGVCDDLKYGGDGTGTRDTDGPVGLGFGHFNSIRPTPQCTFMECLEPYVPEPVFSTKFKLDNSGFVDFGSSSSSDYTGDVTAIPIDNSTGQWLASSVQFGSGGNVFNASAISMDFDTGTSTLSIPSDTAASYFALVPSAAQDSGGSWYYNCDDSLPGFDYVFGKTNSGPSTVTVPGDNIKNGKDSRNTDSTCYTWIGTTDGDGNAGVPFYITEYMMFNQADPSLSFAAQS